MELEKLFTLDQRTFIRKYKKGEKFTMKELECIPYKFWAEDGTGLNMKFINEKMEEDLKIRYINLRSDLFGGGYRYPGEE